MIITINDDWRLRSDALQWVIERRKKRMTADDSRKHSGQWASVAFFGDLAQSLRWLAERRIRASEGEYPAAALEPLCDTLQAIREDTNRALATIETEMRSAVLKGGAS